jgi:hypothetical protein
MKNNEIITLANQLPTLGNLTGAKFAYAIAKNQDIATREAKHLSEGLKSTPEYQEYEKKRIELCEELSKKDESGKAMMIPIGNGVSRYVFEDEKAFNKELEKLGKEYKEVLDARKKQEEDYNKLLEEESTVEFFKMDQDIIPDNITVQQMNIIKNLIN